MSAFEWLLAGVVVAFVVVAFLGFAPLVMKRRKAAPRPAGNQRTTGALVMHAFPVGDRVVVHFTLGNPCAFDMPADAASFLAAEIEKAARLAREKGR